MKFSPPNFQKTLLSVEKDVGLKKYQQLNSARSICRRFIVRRFGASRITTKLVNSGTKHITNTGKNF